MFVNGSKRNISPLCRYMDSVDGFSLIEVLIAMAIFSIGILAVGAMQLQSMNVNFSGGQLTSCSTIAQGKIEELMTLDYDNDQLTQDGSPHIDADPPESYEVSWVVTDGIPIPGAKEIVVMVAGRGKTVRLTYVKAQPPEGA